MTTTGMGQVRRTRGLPHLSFRGLRMGSRATPSNYLHNHLGNFASSADAVCRGLFLGGCQTLSATDLRLHGGGVAWARNLYCDLISHWENVTAGETRRRVVDHVGC